MTDLLAFINQITETDKILSAILLFFSFWILPRYIWPWWKERESRNFEYKMKLDLDEEMCGEKLERLITSSKNTERELILLNERVNKCGQLITDSLGRISGERD